MSAVLAGTSTAASPRHSPWRLFSWSVRRELWHSRAIVFAPFAIGATVLAGALVIGPLTGGSFNPARTLGPSVAGGVWTAHWLYWAAPIVGMMGGMRLHDLLQGRSAPSAEHTPLGTDGPIAG